MKVLNKRALNAQLLADYAKEKGIGIRAAQKQRKNESSEWVLYLSKNAPNDYALENKITDQTEYMPSEGVIRARKIYEAAWAEWERAEKRLKEVQRPESRMKYNLSRELPLAQKGHESALNILGKAQALLEAAEVAAGRLIHVTALDELFRNFSGIFEEINKLPETIAAESGLAAIEAEQLVRHLLITRLNPLIERASSSFLNFGK